jgi:hypothetical protein
VDIIDKLMGIALVGVITIAILMLGGIITKCVGSEIADSKCMSQGYSRGKFVLSGIYCYQYNPDATKSDYIPYKDTVK